MTVPEEADVRIITKTLILTICLSAGLCAAGPTIMVPELAETPTVDGVGGDTVWDRAPQLTVQDAVANIPLDLRAVNSGGRIYFLVRYPDEQASETHRSWTWNEEAGEYESGLDREDCLVLKWFLNGSDEDLSLSSSTAYTADVWFWKACRTNPVGFADDKYQILSDKPMENALELLSKAGTPMFLKRLGDEGSSAYRTRIQLMYEDNVMARFENREPTGSRADIHARGTWSDGYWTIEFSRALKTDHVDDVQLAVGGQYRFGVSRYEISGRQPEAGTSQPLYGCGDIAEVITLVLSGDASGQVQ